MELNKLKNGFKILGCLGILILSSLTACTSVQQSQAVAAIEAAYTIDATVAAQYKNGELGIKPTDDVVSNMQLADNLAKTRLDILRSAARNGSALSASETLLATDALNAYTILLQKLGLLKATVSKDTTSVIAPEPK